MFFRIAIFNSPLFSHQENDVFYHFYVSFKNVHNVLPREKYHYNYSNIEEISKKWFFSKMLQY